MPATTGETPPGDVEGVAPRAPEDGAQELAAGGPAGRNLPRAVVVLLGGAGLVVLLAGVQALQSLIGPAFLAFTLVLIITPAQQWLLRHRVPGVLVITASIVVLYAVILGLLAALALSIAALIRVLPTYVGQFESYYQDALDQLDRIGVSGQLISQAVEQVSPASVFGVATTFLQQLLNGVTSVTTVVVLLAVIVLFLVVDALSAPQRVAAAARSHEPLMEAMVAFTAGVRRYWLVTTVFGAVVAALDVVALLVIGVPLALTWGVLAFITNYIPNVGFVLGLVPPALIAVLDGGLADGILVVVVYSVLNVVIQTIIQPRFTGDAVGLTATVAFLSLLFWSVVLGPLGALLAIPATSFAKAVLVDADPSARWLNAFVAADPEGTLDPPREPRRRTVAARRGRRSSANTVPAAGAPRDESDTEHTDHTDDTDVEGPTDLAGGDGGANGGGAGTTTSPGSEEAGAGRRPA